MDKLTAENNQLKVLQNSINYQLMIYQNSINYQLKGILEFCIIN